MPDPTKKLTLVMIFVPQPGIIWPMISQTDVTKDDDHDWAELIAMESPDLWYIAETNS